MRNPLFSTIVACLVTAAASRFAIAVPATTQAADATPIVVRLWPGDPPATQPIDSTDVQRSPRGDPDTVFLSGVQAPSLTVYLPPPVAAPTPAFVICPGGGYAFESFNHEGIDAARKRLPSRGVAGIVLKYRLPDAQPPPEGQLPVPQQDVLRAIQIVRAHAGEWNIDPAKVGVMGFSAGGHLAATAATLFGDAGTFADKAGNDAASKLSARPDFAVLLYPVITMGEQTHAGSARKLLGEHPDAGLVARFSADQRVTADTPPLFIVQAEDDNVVPIANALLMADAAAKAHVPCQLLLLQKGGHGFGLGKPNTEAATWFYTMTVWMHARGILAGN